MMQSSVLNRLESLEADTRSLTRSVRRWKRASVLLAGLLVTGILVAAGPMGGGVLEVVKAKELHIVNEKGDSLVKLSQDADGGSVFVKNVRGHAVFETYAGVDRSGVLFLSEAGGGKRISAHAHETGGVFHALTDFEVPGVALSLGRDGAGQVVVYGEDPRASAHLTVDANAGRLFLENTNGKTIVEIGADEARRGRLVASDANGKAPAITLASNETGGSFSVHDTSGATSFWAHNSEVGRGLLTLYNGSDAPTAQIGSDDDGGALYLFNEYQVPVVTGYVDPVGRGVMSLQSEGGGERFYAGVDDDGGTLFVMSNSDTAVMESYASPDGDGLLILSERDAGARLELVGDPDTGLINFWNDGEEPERTIRVGEDD